MASGNSSWKLYFLQMLSLGVGQIGFRAKNNKHYHSPTGRRAEDLQRSGGLPRDPSFLSSVSTATLKFIRQQ